MACGGEVLKYNSHGEEYEVPRRRVYSIYELQSGDHIALHRYKGVLWHHAIVEDVDTELGEVYVIHYNNTASGFLRDNSSHPLRPGLARVQEGTYRFREVTMYLMMHKECLDPDTVVANARIMIGDGNYNPIISNCEHFAMWCKTGRWSSDQIDKAVNMVGKETIKQTASQAGGQLVKTGAGITTKVAGQSASQAGKAFVRTGMRQSLSQAGQNATMASNVGSGLGGALALGAAFEGLSLLHDIHRAGRDLGTGQINEEEFNKTVRKRVMTGAGAITGTAAGAAVGQALIPVPLLGAAVGGVIGGVAGRFFGNIAGHVVAEVAEDDSGGGGVDYYYHYPEHEDHGGGDDYYYFYEAAENDDEADTQEGCLYYYEDESDDDEDNVGGDFYYYDEAEVDSDDVCVYYYDDSDVDEDGGFVYSYY